MIKLALVLLTCSIIITEMTSMVKVDVLRVAFKDRRIIGLLNWGYKFCASRLFIELSKGIVGRSYFRFLIKYAFIP